MVIRKWCIIIVIKKIKLSSGFSDRFYNCRTHSAVPKDNSRKKKKKRRKRRKKGIWGLGTKVGDAVKHEITLETVSKSQEEDWWTEEDFEIFRQGSVKVGNSVEEGVDI